MKKRFMAVLILASSLAAALAGEGQKRFVSESARNIPVAYTVDVVVVGGSTGAVAAAAAAVKEGAKVFLAAPFPYLGDDMAGTLRVWLEEGEKPTHPLAAKIFEAGNPARPLHVKKVLDEALLETGVQFLFSCHATDILRDADGNPCGIVMANRSGRQAVVAKVIIDATDGAWVAAMANPDVRQPVPRRRTVKRVVVGGDIRTGQDLSARKPIGPFVVENKPYYVIEYTFAVPMKDGSWSSFAEAEQIARDLTYHPDQEFASDVLFDTAHVMIKSERGKPDEWRGVEKADLRSFRPRGVPRMYVVSACAEVLHEGALDRPSTLIAMGTRIGQSAAKEAESLPSPKGVRVAGVKAASATSGEVKESLVGVRPTEPLPTIPQDERSIPVIGEYDVVVVGGGTSGAAAGISAARQGAKALVIEYLYGLGGVGTQGAISKYYHGYRGGFTKEVAGALASWRIEPKMEWWRSALRKAGADIWFGTIGCGAFVDRGVVTGVIVATPQGRGVVLAKTVVDATGNADIAAVAGAPCLYTDESDIAMQGTGLPPRELGASYTNTDFTIVDETDVVDVSHVLVYAKDKYKPGTFDMGQLIDTRERRRVVGDYTLTVQDEMTSRTFPDTVGQTMTNYDTHGYTVDPLFYIHHPSSRVEFRVYVPYRCILPRGLDGLLVTGLGVSAHRDAIPLIRMQPDLQNLGYAAGVAAAMSAKGNYPTRSVNIRELQKHLVEIGNLPPTVLTDEDSSPLSPARIEAAVKSVTDVQNRYRHQDVAAILSQPNVSLPLLRKDYKGATSQDDKLIYAQILGMMGDGTGLETLIAAVESSPTLDVGWNFKSQGQFGANMSPLDSLIVALGRTGDRRATPAIVKKLNLLDTTQDFSHHRAIALALEALGDPAATGALAEVLAKPGMSGNAIRSIEEAREREKKSTGEMNSLETRRESLREIILARALFRCGDKNGIGKKILTDYTKDLRGHFARHATAVLQGQKTD